MTLRATTKTAILTDMAPSWAKEVATAAAAVTSTSIDAAIALIGVTGSEINLG